MCSPPPYFVRCNKVFYHVCVFSQSERYGSMHKKLTLLVPCPAYVEPMLLSYVNLANSISLATILFINNK